jgi:putative ABC transport system permease protein
MGMRVIAGRGFGENDRAGQPHVMLINRTLERSGYLGDHPIGTRVYAAGGLPWEVVGIVDDVHQYGLDREPDPQIFIDVRQLPSGNPYPYYAVRADGDPTALTSRIRSVVRELDSQAIVDNVAPMRQLVSNSIARPRLYAVLLGIFAGVAAALAAIGTYGVLAYSVTRRTREIGIRVALGAQRGEVLSLVLRQSAVLTIIGLGLGLAGAAAVTRYLEGLLFGLTPLDPVTFGAVTVLFAAIATVASYVPARRAATVDPLIALRCE